MRKRTELYKRLCRLIEQNKEGFTASQNGELLNLKKGYAVAITNNKEQRISRLINKVLNMKKPLNPYYYGGWFDVSSNSYYLDITIVKEDLNEALTTARQHKQKAIFNFSKMESIEVTAWKRY